VFKRIDHVEIIPLDTNATLAFYTDVLGFEIKERTPVPAPPMREVIYLTLADTMIELVIVDGPSELAESPWQAGCRLIALEVEDMQAAVEYLASKGVTVSRPPVDLGDSWRAEILDPNGFSIELREWKS
jgi:catechol 2,3-dioxygenase-like lactoylglutathione lyase family enzyme